MADRTDHLIMLMGMMGATSSAGDGEGVNAFRLATKELERQGLSWRDVAEKAFRSKPSDIWQGTPPRRESTRREPPPPPPPPQPKPEPVKIRRTGFDIHAAISGVVRVLDDDIKARLLIVEVESADCIYGPMIAYAGTVRDNILAANRHPATLRVRPPRNETSLAQIVACRGHF